jgi:hypothetical protein
VETWLAPARPPLRTEPDRSGGVPYHGGSAMPRYSFQVESSETCCELHGIDLPDADCAETFVVDLISALFNRAEIFDAGDWSTCAVHVLGENRREILTRTAGEIALLEREHCRESGSRWLIN